MDAKERRKVPAFVRILALICVRQSRLETLHEDLSPITRTGDHSDVVVVDADGRRIPWPEVSRFNEDEMRDPMREVVNKLYTFFVKAEDPDFKAWTDFVRPAELSLGQAEARQDHDAPCEGIRPWPPQGRVRPGTGGRGRADKGRRPPVPERNDCRRRGGRAVLGGASGSRDEAQCLHSLRQCRKLSGDAGLLHTHVRARAIRKLLGEEAPQADGGGDRGRPRCGARHSRDRRDPQAAMGRVGSRASGGGIRTVYFYHAGPGGRLPADGLRQGRIARTSRRRTPKRCRGWSRRSGRRRQDN